MDSEVQEDEMYTYRKGDYECTFFAEVNGKRAVSLCKDHVRVLHFDKCIIEPTYEGFLKLLQIYQQLTGEQKAKNEIS